MIIIMMPITTTDNLNIASKSHLRHVTVTFFPEPLFLHSAKGGAVETGYSDLYGVIYDFTI